MARTAIGLDVGTSVVRAVELSHGRAGVTLERFGQVVLPEGAVADGEVVDAPAVTAALRELWSATRFTHRRVVVGVANQRVVVRQLDIPWTPREELRASLPFAVQELLPIPVEQSVLDFFPLQDTTDEQGSRIYRGLLVAASRDTVMANVTCVHRAGLTVDAVDLTPFAVLRALGRCQGVDVRTEALVDVGAKVTNIVVHSMGVPRFVRILLMGGQDVTDMVAERLGVTTAEAEALKQRVVAAPTAQQQALVAQSVTQTMQDFVDEIRSSIDYYGASYPGNPVERVQISGGGARLAGLVDRLADVVRLPVVDGDPLSPLRLGRTGLDPAQIEFVTPLATVPVGLAMGAL